MQITLNENNLIAGTTWESGGLRMPLEGGGLSLEGLREATERYLNFTLTVEASHSMPFELRVYGDGENKPRVTVRFGVMPRYRTNVCIDLNWLDGHVLFPGHIPGELKVVCHGSRIERGEIVRAELVSLPCCDEILVRIEGLALNDAPIPAAQPPEKKLIDAMGQYIPKKWPGKLSGIDEMIQKVRAQADMPGEYPFAGWTRWGGESGMRFADGTGFFTRVKRDGRWYLLDPDGCAFFSMGPDCVVARADARVDGLESLLEWDPDDPDVVEAMQRDWGENGRGRGRLISFERANLKRAFGKDYREQWRRMVVGQLKRMGMNTLGNWTDGSLYGRMPYVTSLPRFPGTAVNIFRDFPDVLSPEYRADAERCAQALAARRDDPYMIGYFLRNEPGWAFVDNLIIADEVLRNPADTWCRRGLIDWLRKKYGDIDALNRAWNAGFGGFDDLSAPIESASALSEGAEADLRAFSAELVRAYTAIPSSACRAVDPNHMILGMRWAWISDPALVSGWDCFDVFSINCYAVEPTFAIERVRELGVDLPVMIGEFHFGALDAGLTATGLEGVVSQADRGKAYRYYMEHAAAHPYCVGCHWFQCYDQFALGRFDGENYNIGLFDVCFQPYPEMAEAVRACSGGILEIHAGRRMPVDEKARAIPMIAY